jgi:hypothetical protein
MQKCAYSPVTTPHTCEAPHALQALYPVHETTKRNKTALSLVSATVCPTCEAPHALQALYPVHHLTGAQPKLSGCLLNGYHLARLHSIQQPQQKHVLTL